MNSNCEIHAITTQETLGLRKSVLKPFLTEEECINPGDDLPTTLHYGLFHQQKLISIATFIKEDHSDFSTKLAYRLRGMATDPNYHRQGFGKMLLTHSMKQLKKQGCDFLWFNARIKAFPFYEKLGCSYHGPLFELKDIGLHKVMYKHLIPS